MKKTILITLLASLIFGACSISAAPRLLIENDQFNFGFAPQNSKISHIFWLKSAGDDSLKILKVVPG